MAARRKRRQQGDARPGHGRGEEFRERRGEGRAEDARLHAFAALRDQDIPPSLPRGREHARVHDDVRRVRRDQEPLRVRRRPFQRQLRRTGDRAGRGGERRKGEGESRVRGDRGGRSRRGKAGEGEARGQRRVRRREEGRREERRRDSAFLISVVVLMNPLACSVQYEFLSILITKYSSVKYSSVF